MASDITVIDLTAGRVEVSSTASKGPAFVHRTAIADAANSLLMAYDGGPEAVGVVALAKALGCNVKVAK